MNLITLLELIYRLRKKSNTLEVLRAWMKKVGFYHVDRVLDLTWNSHYTHRKRIYARIVAVTGGLNPETDETIRKEVEEIADSLGLDVEYKQHVYNRVRDDIRTELPTGPPRYYTAAIRIA